LRLVSGCFFNKKITQADPFVNGSDVLAAVSSRVWDINVCRFGCTNRQTLAAQADGLSARSKKAGALNTGFFTV
jgi:hypothetical protein